MVHALLQTHRMLRPQGVLVSVHYLSMPHLIEVRSPETVRKAGWFLDRGDFADEHSASNALARVVADRYFVPEDERDFDYSYYGDRLPEFWEWLAGWWSTGHILDGTLQQLDEMLQAAGPSAQIALVMKARMTKLRVA